MLHYILQTIVFQFFFLAVYDLFLKRETFFNYNRIYLLVTTLLSLVLPFIKIKSFKNVVSQDYFITLPEIILGDTNNTKIAKVAIETINQNFYWYISLVLYIGMCIAALLFAYKIIKITKLIISNPKYKKGNLVIVKLSKSNTAFSFFNYVFLGENIEDLDYNTILEHEQIHVQQKHTLDLLFFEIFRVLFWFNPLMYMYQNRIADVHEFIADQKASKNNNIQYYKNLLAQIFNVKQVSLVNPFFKQSLIKKRILMLQKSKSKKRNLIKYLFLIPLLVCMLIYTSCSQQEATAETVDQDLEQVVEKFRNQLQTENSKLTKEERLELAEYIIDEFKANIEHEEDEMSFATIDEVPIFPNCRNVKDKKACFNTEIAKHFIDNFNLEIADQLGLKEIKRIMVVFKIDKNGNVIDAKATAEKPELEKEAIRIVNLLPKVIPGKHNGKPVTVPYELPLKFKINE